MHISVRFKDKTITSGRRGLGRCDGSCAAAKLAEQIMLTEERSLTAIERCECITLHSRIFDITTKAENGEAWLMLSRPSTFLDAAEMERLSLVSGGDRHG